MANLPRIKIKKIEVNKAGEIVSIETWHGAKINLIKKGYNFKQPPFFTLTSVYESSELIGFIKRLYHSNGMIETDEVYLKDLPLDSDSYAIWREATQIMSNKIYELVS